MQCRLSLWPRLSRQVHTNRSGGYKWAARLWWFAQFLKSDVWGLSTWSSFIYDPAIFGHPPQSKRWSLYETLCTLLCIMRRPSAVFFFNVVILFWPFFVWFPQFTSSAVVAITHSWPSSGCGPSCRPIGRSSSKTSSADCKHGPNKSIPCSPPTSHRAPRTALLQQKLVVETPLLQYTNGHPIRPSIHTTCIWFI